MPHWVIYQSRVLGPYAVHLLGELLGSKAWGFFALMLACLTAANLIFLKVLKEFEPPYRYVGLLMLQLLIAVSLNSSWLYPWDLCSLVLFSCFLLLVARDAPTWQFVALFAVAVFNRESALFMALWLMAQPVCTWWLSRSGGASVQPSLQVSRMVVGLVLLLAGLGLISFLRQYLLVREVGPELWNLHELAGKSVHWKHDYNFKFLRLTLTGRGTDVDAVLPYLYGLAFVLLWRVVRVEPSRWLALVLDHAMMLVAIYFVAVLPETRVFMELAPFLAFAGVLAIRQACEAAP